MQFRIVGEYNAGFILFVVALLMVASAAAAQPIQLITDKEAKLPPATQAPSRGITRGPAMKLLSPEGMDAFPLKVVLRNLPHLAS